MTGKKRTTSTKRIIAAATTRTRITSDVATTTTRAPKQTIENICKRQKKTSKDLTDKRKFKSIWVAARRLRKCWIKIIAKMNGRVADSVTQASGFRWPLSPSVVNYPSRIVMRDRNDKRFSAYAETTSLF